MYLFTNLKHLKMLNPIVSVFRNRFCTDFLTGLILILLSAIPAISYSADTTSIVVVGTVHNQTEKFTGKQLYDIIERIKPDLILVELDSSFFSESMSIKPDLINVSLENTVVNDYQKSRAVLVRPYDIEGRNKIYQVNNYFGQQRELSKSLNNARKDSLLHGEPMVLLDAMTRFDGITQSFASGSPEIFNSASCMKVMESKQYYANEGMVKIVSSVPFLNPFIKFANFKRDFWIQRNEVMVNKILKWNKSLHPKTILVLCGFEHKYFLYDGLLKRCNADIFKLKEYWEY